MKKLYDYLEKLWEEKYQYEFKDFDKEIFMNRWLFENFARSIYEEYFEGEAIGYYERYFKVNHSKRTIEFFIEKSNL